MPNAAAPALVAAKVAVLVAAQLAASPEGTLAAAAATATADPAPSTTSTPSPAAGDASKPVEALPTIVLREPGLVVKQSCIIEIPEGVIIATKGDLPVIRIAASEVHLRFAPGSVLRGDETTLPPDNRPPDEFVGTAIAVDAHAGVTIEGARIEGYKVGIAAAGADRLKITGCSFRNLYRQKLASTPSAEDQRDWLWPHSNDQGQWKSTYGAAIWVERCKDVEISRCTVREGQNGICLSRVAGARVFDNDASFLSGWGLALWRVTGSTISRNAFDFCIRGYSHGVYNRGQDSAGILMFEQCSGNLIAENSVTHGGDGIFAFAGKEALGEDGPADLPRQGAGCNENVFYRNDLSYAAAHGLELTFSFGNRIAGNRMAGNAICGIWGGYSQMTVIDDNTIEDNGLPGQAEGGGINIEHGFANTLIGNRFARNSQAVAMWANPSAQMAKLPWHKANHRGSIDNVFVANRFEADTRPVVLRDTRSSYARDNTRAGAEADDIFVTDAHSDIRDARPPSHLIFPPVPALRQGRPILGTTKPVGARANLAGRHNIVMTNWGPWDHQSPLLRASSSKPNANWADRYDLFNPPDGCNLQLILPDGVTEQQVFAAVTPPDADGQPVKIAVRSAVAGAWPYTLSVSSPSFVQTVRGTLLNASWKATFFPWIIDPRATNEARMNWRAEAGGARAVTVTIPNLNLRFGYGGPSSVKLDDAANGNPEATEAQATLAAAKLPADRFGMLASTVVPLAPGRYVLTTTSDDGIRVNVKVGGGLGGVQGEATPVITRWTQHGPTKDIGTFTVPPLAQPTGNILTDRVPVAIEVEYFELDGYSTIELSLEASTQPVEEAPAGKAP